MQLMANRKLISRCLALVALVFGAYIVSLPFFTNADMFSLLSWGMMNLTWIKQLNINRLLS